MRKVLSSFLVVIFLLFPLFAHACTKKYGGIFCRDTAWDNISSAIISFPEHPNEKYNFDFGNNVIQISVHANNNVYQFILMEPGIYMYSKKLPPVDHAFEYFEGFMGQIKIISHILNSSFPNGPTSIQRKENINLKSQTESIKLVIDPGTIGRFGAPWSATGFIKKLNKDRYHASIIFIFQDYHTKEVVTQNYHINLDYSNTSFKLPDLFKLENYHVISLSNSKEISNIKSIGELNKYLKKHGN